jgi:hypothetical protein
MCLLATFQFYFIFLRVEVCEELIFIPIIKLGRDDGDLCDCMNLVGISMKKIYFGSCIVLFGSFVCSRFGSP